MDIKKVRGNTFCIDTGMSYIPFYKINNEEIIMLDSGLAREERKEIDKLLQKNNFKVVGIICSHAHIDHIGNIAYFKNKYNCIVAMPAYEALICSSTLNLKVYYSNQTLSDVTDNFEHMVCKTDIIISDKQESIYMHDIKFKILHTPGHSPAHICIITPDDVVYLGDTLISYEVMECAQIPYVFILNEDLKSKKKLYDLKYSKYIVAHKGIYNDITKLITDNIDFYKNRAVKVYEAIDSTMTMEDIVSNVIKNWNIRVKNIYKYSMLEKMLRTYVEYLNETGMINLVMEDGLLKYKKSPQGISRLQEYIAK
ncbi:MBL fold metallo-hydrolase [Tepidibacter aestuarii]|uniref:MBL fold metallo-hydrolase n=1 Tax=Tepidibacter aestuarii TaxID=2925782 RepID=UPI0020BF7A51|nr:MBL fold metallo-hydrolase [Tepidibacter aestuarii]CAH2215409.1 Hydrolase [Tepidibacter aestuarii]